MSSVDSSRRYRLPGGTSLTTHVEAFALTIPSEPWVQDALCAQTDPDLFFPDKNEKGTDKATQARRVCAACPVREDCLEWVLQHPQRHGIWAGLSRSQRDRLKAAA